MVEIPASELKKLRATNIRLATFRQAIGRAYLDRRSGLIDEDQLMDTIQTAMTIESNER